MKRLLIRLRQFWVAVERGTAKKLKSLKVPLAGKTGTTNNNYDAWFIGYSSNLVIEFT